MRCDLVATGKVSAGRHLHRCQRCGGERSAKSADPSSLAVMCSAEGDSRLSILSSKEIAKLVPGEADEKLIGDRLAEIFAAVGIPECGGCTKRKEWMNRAHAWVNSMASAARGS